MAVSNNKGKTVDRGPCATEGCEGRRKWYASEYCKACRDKYRWRMAQRGRRARRRAGADKNLWLAEERNIQAALARPLVRTRHKAYLEVATAVKSLEYYRFSYATVGLFYRWITNPDNLCDNEALDNAGW